MQNTHIHLEQYHQTNQACARLITQRYSTSFTLGIRTLHSRFHMPVYSIYGFVRYADEIVDTFHEHDKQRLFNSFVAQTWQAIEDKISLNPVLDAFQWVVNKYEIDHTLITAFLASMDMDLTKACYDPVSYQKYIYGSAEVVGLMCLQVFCEGNMAQYAQLEPSAKSLGAAFQKVNFLRDVQSDYADRGRVYFPGVDLTRFGPEDKGKIEADIEADFKHAYQGIKQLPPGARLGVYLAYAYYKRLFAKIKHTPPAKILQSRIRVPDAQKLLILCSSYFKHRLNLI